MATPGTLYLPSYANLRRHPKIRRLAKALNISIPQAIGHMHCLWWFAMETAPDGDLSRVTDEDIALAAEWDDDAHHFVSSAQNAGFLDTYQIHDWEDYAGRFLQKRERDRINAAERQRRKRSVTRESHDVTRESRHVTHNKEEIREDKRKEENSLTGVQEEKTPPASRKAKLPDDWFPSDANLLYASNQGMSNEEIQHQSDLFRDHWIANGEVRQNWDATWRNWIRRVPQFSKPNGRNGHHSIRDMIDIANRTIVSPEESERQRRKEAEWISKNLANS